MNRSRRAALFLAALFAGLGSGTVAGAQADARAAPTDSAPEEIVVTAKALEDLRLRIKLAEDDVYARFNEINSDDSYDIHCYERASAGTRIVKRLCVSNAWRARDTAFAEASVRDLQSRSAGVASGMDPAGAPSSAGSGGYSHVPQQHRPNQYRTERLVTKELADLASADPVLREAMVRVGQAYQALEAVTDANPEWTLYREVEAGEGEHPFGAKRLVEVRVGETAWRFALASRTFTITAVMGRIRDLRVRCAASSKKLEYAEDVDWTIPESWGDCTLSVSAKRGTTFALYEF